jgi:hypothetical protein
MSVKQASAALGLPLVGAETAQSSLHVDPECSYVWPQNHTPRALRFMRRHDRIVRIDMGGHYALKPNPMPLYRTTLGAYIGMPEEKLKALYKPLLVRAHKYTTQGREYIANPNQSMQLHFETDGKRVITIRAGRSDEVNCVDKSDYLLKDNRSKARSHWI